MPVSLFPLAFIQFRNITDLEPWKLQDLRTSTNLRREELASAIALLSQASEQEVLAKYRPLDHPGSSNGGHNGGLVVFESKKSDQRKVPHLRVRPHRCIPLGDHPVRGPAWDPTRAAWRSHSRGGFLWPQESSMFLIRKISIIG